MAQARPDERPPLAVIVAANVYRRRMAKDPRWSQEKLARMAELSRSTVAVIEDSRDPSRAANAARLDTLDRIASALGCKPEDLLEWDPEATRVFLNGHPSRFDVIDGEVPDDAVPSPYRQSPVMR